MELAGRHVVITGAGSGIGRALALRLARERPRAVVALDLDADAAAATSGQTGVAGLGLAADVGDEASLLGAIAAAEEAHGPIDLFCSNAGLTGSSDGPAAPDDDWQRLWNVNVMAHVWAARALLPAMLARGEGYLLSTVSAAGLLMSPGHMGYTATKHAALAVAECLAVDYGDRGVRVSCFCPQVVETPMFDAIRASDAGRALQAGSGAISPTEAAEAVAAGIRDERFLILSHPEVVEYARRRADDHDRWIAGMRRLRAKAAG